MENLRIRFVKRIKMIQVCFRVSFSIFRSQFFCKLLYNTCTIGSVLYERLKKKYIFDSKSGVIEEATPETYVEDTYLTKK